MRKVQKNDTVTIEFEGLLDNEEIIESSSETGPFELKVGSGAMPQGFEDALIGMQIGEEKSVTLQPEEAFGHRDETLLHTVSRYVFGENIVPKTGMVIGMNVEKDGTQQKIPALISGINGDEVTIDFNHPLAGKTVTYRFTVKSIKGSG